MSGGITGARAARIVASLGAVFVAWKTTVPWPSRILPSATATLTVTGALAIPYTSVAVIDTVYSPTSVPSPEMSAVKVPESPAE